MTERHANEIGHRSHALLLRRLGEKTQGDVALELGMSPSALSEMKNRHAEPVLMLLGHLGLKVVPASFRCIAEDKFVFLTEMHARMVQRAPQLLWGEDE